MRLAIQYLRSIIFFLIFYGWLAIFGILFAPFALFSRRLAYWAVHAFNNQARCLLKIICGVRTEVRGQIPTGNVLVASKHQSFLDAVILASVLPNVSYIIKRAINWIPVLGFYARQVGSTAVTRGAGSKAVRELIEGADANAVDTQQLVIYPQGTRLSPGAKSPYKIGAYFLYEKLGNPCIPAATNVGLFWPRKGILRKPGIAVVEFLEPIPPGLDRDTFMAELEFAIETASDRLLSESSTRYENFAVFP
ncbi:MAG: 1-acyl-sn-glycerol-3-phosphate acyltransferase [Marinicaulis sp.]|nr:1-acyl-sn-glycerol-3-phosphate acyltransferase [Marinicaulis sp.]NNE40071.1 1-acyl-sn-glycerol-3-phosphate acyltransferase [Marinicaulis sp.]NNL88442.1 1-acyl-sn-glycerol-3-phosphate acyltransferase [Marinicaulis sp.]